MGYVRERKTFRLEFSDPELDGLVVRVRSMSMTGFFDITSLIALKDKKPADVTPEDVKSVRKLFEAFAAALVDWNLEETDEGSDEVRPVPATLEGIYSQEPDLMFAVIWAWLDVVINMTGEEKSSNGHSNGDPELEADLPMEVLSP
jgi:hypothetical protein